MGAAVLVFAHGQGAVSRLLGTRPIAALGLWSYSIYMVHSLVLAVMSRGFSALGKALGDPLVFWRQGLGGDELVISFANPWVMDLLALAYVAVVVALAALAWRHIEMPAQRWLNARASVATIGAARLTRWCGFRGQPMRPVSAKPGEQ